MKFVNLVSGCCRTLPEIDFRRAFRFDTGKTFYADTLPVLPGRLSGHFQEQRREACPLCRRRIVPCTCCTNQQNRLCRLLYAVRGNGKLKKWCYGHISSEK